VSKDELSEDRNLAQSKRAKARLILTFSASTNRESVAYRSFRRAGESCHAGGVRKITTGMEVTVIFLCKRNINRFLSLFFPILGETRKKPTKNIFKTTEKTGYKTSQQQT